MDDFYNWETRIGDERVVNLNKVQARKAVEQARRLGKPVKVFHNGREAEYFTMIHQGELYATLVGPDMRIWYRDETDERR